MDLRKTYFGIYIAAIIALILPPIHLQLPPVWPVCHKISNLSALEISSNIETSITPRDRGQNLIHAS